MLSTEKKGYFNYETFYTNFTVTTKQKDETEKISQKSSKLRWQTET